MLAYLINTIIFLLAGIIIGYKAMVQVTILDFVFSLLIYVFLAIIRATVFITLMPLLQRFGYGLNRKDAIVAWWGGLRGSVGLALALNVFNQVQALQLPPEKDAIRYKILREVSQVLG